MAATGTYGRILHLLSDSRAAGAIMALWSVAVLWVTETQGWWGDLDHYYLNAGDALSGLMPYSEMMFEYPPLSMLFMIVPRLLSWDLSSFHFACAAQTYIFLIIGAFFLHRISDRFMDGRWRVHFLLIALIAFGFHFVIARNDVYPATISIIGIWLFLEKRYAPAFAVIAAGAFTKLYPAVFLLPMLVPLLAKRDWPTLAKCILAAAAVCIIVELPFLIADPETAFAYLYYHSDRGIQIESVASGFFMMASLLFPSDIGVVFNYGSDNLTGAGPEALAPWMNPMLAIVLAAFFLAMLRRVSESEKARSDPGPIVALSAAAALMLFILFSKVYSAQYFIWIALALPFTQLSCFGRAQKRNILVTTIVFGIFTMLSYIAYFECDLPGLEPFPIVMVFVKNLFHIALTAEILHMCWSETRPDGCDAEKKPTIWHRACREGSRCASSERSCPMEGFSSYPSSQG